MLFITLGLVPMAFMDGFIAFLLAVSMLVKPIKDLTEVNSSLQKGIGSAEVLFSYLVSRRVFSESFSRAEKIGMGLMLLGLVVTCLQA